VTHATSALTAKIDAAHSLYSLGHGLIRHAVMMKKCSGVQKYTQYNLVKT